MAKTHITSPLFTLLSLLFLLPAFLSNPSAAAAATASTPPPPPPPICKATPYPSFCNTVLPSGNSSSNVYDYTRISLNKSISASKKFLSLINKYLGNRKTLTITAIRALQDCQFLAQCNVDNLIAASQTINKTSGILPVTQADDIQTLLSASLTNTQTCIDGIQTTASAWSIANGVLAPLANDTRLYSVSLALFTKGWVPKGRRKKPFVHKKHLRPGNGKGLNLKMSAHNQAVYRSVMNNRRLLQAGNGSYDDQIPVVDLVVVSQDGLWDFMTINDAVAAAPTNITDGSNGYFVIYVKAGVYEEYVSIAKNKRFLMMIGDGINQTVITGNRSVVDGWTTFNCSTFAVVASNFVAVDITFRNTAGPSKHQAVAVRNGADLSTFYRCSFEAYQDTLYVHSLRQFYSECDVYGTVDFIFGNAATVLQNCNIYPRLPMSGQFNAITAQGRTDPNQNTGISFQNCTIRPTDDLAANLANSTKPTKTYLGRPWKEYSRTVYMQSFMDSLIDPTGWSVWSGDFALNTSYYAEFANYGPGSNTSGRVTWPGFHVIGAGDAANFTVAAFISGDAWIPQTGVTYTSGLL